MRNKVDSAADLKWTPQLITTSSKYWNSGRRMNSKTRRNEVSGCGYLFLMISTLSKMSLPYLVAIFVENSFAQTISHEVDYSSNQMTSRVIETLLPAVSEEVLLRFGAAFAPSLRTLVSDPFASHVVEKLCEVASSTKWGSSGKVTEWFRSTASYVLNNLEEFTFDPYANHVMRKVCQCLTGFVQETGKRIDNK